MKEASVVKPGDVLAISLIATRLRCRIACGSRWRYRRQVTVTSIAPQSTSSLGSEYRTLFLCDAIDQPLAQYPTLLWHPRAGVTPRLHRLSDWRVNPTKDRLHRVYDPALAAVRGEEGVRLPLEPVQSLAHVLDIWVSTRYISHLASPMPCIVPFISSYLCAARRHGADLPRRLCRDTSLDKATSKTKVPPISSADRRGRVQRLIGRPPGKVYRPSGRLKRC